MSGIKSGWSPGVYQATPGSVALIWEGDQIYPTERLALMAAYDQISFAVRNLRTNNENDAAVATLIDAGWTPEEAAKTVAGMNRRTR